jgi:hypothetical protein
MLYSITVLLCFAGLSSAKSPLISFFFVFGLFPVDLCVPKLLFIDAPGILQKSFLRTSQSDLTNRFLNFAITVSLNSAIPVNQAPTMADVTCAIPADNYEQPDRQTTRGSFTAIRLRL